MARRVILDTTALIDYERGAFDTTTLDDSDIAISALTVAEYRTAIELADTAERAASRARALAVIVDAVEVLDYTEATAAHHALLIAHVKRSGRPRGAHDLIVAAQAAHTRRVLLSRDAAARFADLPGVIAENP